MVDMGLYPWAGTCGSHMSYRRSPAKFINGNVSTSVWNDTIADGRSLSVWRGAGGVKQNISTIIVEQQTLLRKGLVSLLHHSPYQVLASFSAATELGDIPIGEPPPMLVIVGFSADWQKTAQTLELVRSALPVCKIVVMAESNTVEDVHELLRRADACILNVSSRDVLLKSLDLAFQELKFIVASKLRLRIHTHPSAMEAAIHDFSLPKNGDESRRQQGLELSERERQILASLTRGGSNKAIARTYCITETTVKVHLKSILRKIGVRNRTQAAVWAVENGFFTHSHAPDDHVTAK